MGKKYFVRSLILKNRLLLDLCLEAPQSYCKEPFSNGNLIFLFKAWISKWMGNGDRPDDSIRPDGQGNRDDCTNLYRRDPYSFNLFYHRCPATSAGPSGRGENHPLNSLFTEDLPDLPPITSSRSHGGDVSYGDIIIVK